jgi:ABC-type multidrug transport system ATPase subunit
MVDGAQLAHTPHGIASFTSYLAQTDDAPDYLSPRDLLQCSGALRGMPAREARAASRDLLDRSQLSAIAGRPLRALTDGQRRLARFCAVLMGYPRLLILDQPTAGLDLRQRRWVWDLLQQLHTQTGLTTVLATHHLADADSSASRICFIKAGQIAATGAPNALKAQYGSGPRMDVKLHPGAKLGNTARTKLQALGRIVERDAETFALYPNPETLGALAHSIPAPRPVATGKGKGKASQAKAAAPYPAAPSDNDSWLLDRAVLPGSLGHTVEEVFAIVGQQQIMEFWFAPPSLEDVYQKLLGEPPHV